MPKALICAPPVPGVARQCWQLLVDRQDHEAVSTVAYLFDKLSPAVIGAVVTIIILVLNRGWERRKVSLELYREFYSEEVADARYDAERFFERYADKDWGDGVDPYDLTSEDDDRRGYAAVTRYWARLSILYRERELKRNLSVKLMSQVAGYWWGLVYERMTRRENMYTRKDLIYLFDAMRTGRSSEEFERGYVSGVKRREENAKILSVGAAKI